VGGGKHLPDEQSECSGHFAHSGSPSPANSHRFGYLAAKSCGWPQYFQGYASAPVRRWIVYSIHGSRCRHFSFQSQRPPHRPPVSRVAAWYPGLPRVPAVDTEAMLVSTESAASLLAAVRTAVVRLEPRIISIATCRHVPAGSASRQPVVPSSGASGRHRRWIKIVIETRSQTPGRIQLAAVGGKNRYRLMKPASVTREGKRRRLIIYLRRPKHMTKIIVVLRGQRRTWLATIPISARLRDQ
jgi:hypothetical protein